MNPAQTVSRPGAGQWRTSDLQAIYALDRSARSQLERRAFTWAGRSVKTSCSLRTIREQPYTHFKRHHHHPGQCRPSRLPSTNRLGSWRNLSTIVVGGLHLNSKNAGTFASRFTNHQPNNDGGLRVDRGSRYTDHQNGGGVQVASALNNLLNELRFVSSGAIPEFPSSTARQPEMFLISSVANIGFSPLTTTTTTERSSSILTT